MRSGGSAMHNEHADHAGHRHGPGCGHEQVSHGDHTDFVHDGHRHASHGDHWDEHAPVLDERQYGSADVVGVSDDQSGGAASTWAAGGEDRPEGAGDVGGG